MHGDNISTRVMAFLEKIFCLWVMMIGFLAIGILINFSEVSSYVHHFAKEKALCMITTYAQKFTTKRRLHKIIHLIWM